MFHMDSYESIIFYFMGLPPKSVFFPMQNHRKHTSFFLKKTNSRRGILLEVTRGRAGGLDIFVQHFFVERRTHAGLGVRRGVGEKKTGEAGARLGQYAAAGAAVKLMNSTTHFCSSFPELMCFGRIVLCFWSRFIDIFFGNKQHFYPPKRRDDPHETQHGT